MGIFDFFKKKQKEVIKKETTVKRQSSNPKSECNFWVNSDFIEGNLKHKKRRTNSCESILRFSDLGRI